MDHPINPATRSRVLTDTKFLDYIARNGESKATYARAFALGRPLGGGKYGNPYPPAIDAFAKAIKNPQDFDQLAQQVLESTHKAHVNKVIDVLRNARSFLRRNPDVKLLAEPGVREATWHSRAGLPVLVKPTIVIGLPDGRRQVMRIWTREEPIARHVMRAELGLLHQTMADLEEGAGPAFLDIRRSWLPQTQLPNPAMTEAFLQSEAASFMAAWPEPPAQPAA